jgi:aryl-alcohol dehydrogenase-like predicted oxidoreductase
METCRNNNIPFFSYTSVLKGLADVRLKQISDEEISDMPIDVFKNKVFSLLSMDSERQSLGWFDDEYIRRNISLAKQFVMKAEELKVKPAQLSLAWSVSKGVIPIPATTKKCHLLENMEAAKIALDVDTLTWLDNHFPYGVFQGIPSPKIFATFNNDTALEETVIENE